VNKTAVPNDRLTPDQARSLVERIRSHITDARALVLELHEKEGWKALGYDSWRECVVAEFEQSQSYLYRLLDAAQVEKNISPIGEKPIPESVLRPLTRLEPEQQREAYKEASAKGERPTAKQVKEVVQKLFPTPNGTKYTPLETEAEKEARQKKDVDDAARRFCTQFFCHLFSFDPHNETPHGSAKRFVDQVDWARVNILEPHHSKARLKRCIEVITIISELMRE